MNVSGSVRCTVLALLAIGCGDPPVGVDGGGSFDASSVDSSSLDASAIDAGPQLPPTDCASAPSYRIDEADAWVSSPSIAVDGAGRITVVWQEAEDEVIFTRRQVLARRCTPGSPWSDSVVLGEGTYADAAANAAGHVLVTWRDHDTGTPMAAEHDAGGPWSPSVAIASTPSTEDRVFAGVDAAGSVVAAWSRRSFAIHAPGEAWGDPMSISDTPGDGSFGNVAALDGVVVLMWKQRMGDGPLYARNYSPSGGFTPRTMLHDEVVDLSFHDLAGAGDEAVAIFKARAGAGSTVDVSILTSAGWSPPQSLATVTRSSAVGWNVDMAPDGTAVAAFGVNDRIHAATRRSGAATFADPSDLGRDWLFVTSVAGPGTALAAWPSGGQIAVSRSTAGGPFGTPSRIENSRAVQVYSMDFAPTLDGAFVVAWQDSVTIGSEPGIWVATVR